MKKSKLMTLSLIILVGIMPFIPIVKAVHPNVYDIHTLYFTQNRGEAYVNWNVAGEVSASGTMTYDGTYTFSFEYWRSDDLWNIETDSAMGDFYTMDTVDEIATESYSVSLYGTHSDANCPLGLTSNKFLLPNQDSMVYDFTLGSGSASLTLRYGTYNFGGEFSHILWDTGIGGDQETVPLAYHLEPVLVLDSQYTFNDIRLEVYDNVNDEWVEQNPNEISLNHPYYKYKIWDTTKSEILFEDSSDVLFSVYREITIDSTNFINNDNDPILVQKNNEFNYQSTSDLSWDLETIGSYPSSLEDSEESNAYVKASENDHTNVMAMEGDNNHAWHPEVFPFTDEDSFVYQSGTWGTSEYLSSYTANGITVNDVVHLDDSSASTNGNHYMHMHCEGFIASGLFCYTAGTYWQLNFYANRLEGSANIGLFTLTSGDIDWTGSSTVEVDGAPSIGEWYFFRIQLDIINQNAHVELRDLEGNMEGTQIVDLMTPLTSGLAYMRFYSGTSTLANMYLSSFYTGNDQEASLSILNARDPIQLNYEEESTSIDWGTHLNPDYSDFDQFYGHEKIISHVGPRDNVFTMTGDDGRITYDGNFNQQDSIEFWMFQRDTDPTDPTGASLFSIEDGSIQDSVQITIDDGVFRARNGPYSTAILPCNPFVWYHIRIDYDISTDWHLWINGDQMDNGGYQFRGKPLHFDNMKWWNYIVDTTNMYAIDDFGIVSQGYMNWENTGYNYSNTNTLDFGSEFDHKLEYGELKTGVLLTGDIFNSYDYKKTDSTETTNITGVLQWGNSVDYDLSDWVLDSVSLSIRGKKSNSKNVLEILSGGASKSAYLPITDTNTLFECRYFVPSGSGGGTISFDDDSTNSMYLYFDSSGNLITYTTISGYSDSTYDFEFDSWHHVKITYSNGGNVEFWVDEINIASKVLGNFDNNRIHYFILNDAEYVYVDSIGLSVDGYTTGDNLNIDGWFDTSGTGSKVSNINFDGHKNVISFEDGSSSTSAQLNYYASSNEVDATMEFYIGKSAIGSSASTFNFIGYDDAGEIPFQIRLEGDDLDAYYSSTYNSIYDNWIEVDHLYHFQIIFDDTAKTYDIYIDGIVRGTSIPYRSASANGIYRLKPVTDNVDTGYTGYLDAIGISGSYTPGNNQYLNGWLEATNDLDCHSTIEDYKNHQEVIKLSDYSSSGKSQINYELDSSYTSGSIEFYSLISDSSKELMIRFADSGGTVGLNFHLSEGNIGYYSGGWKALYPIISDVWYHIRIDFDTDLDLADIYLNGEFLETAGFWNSVSDLTTIKFETDDTYSDFNVYVDALGFSWENYESWSNIPEEFNSNGTMEFWELHSGSGQFLTNDFGLEWYGSRSYVSGSSIYNQPFEEDYIDGSDPNWSNNDDASCTSSYLSTKNYNGVMIDDVMVNTDSSGSGRCEVIGNYASSGFVVSGWYASNDVTDAGRLYFVEDGTGTITILQFDGDDLDFYQSGGSYVELSGTANSNWYFYIMILDPDTDTAEIYVYRAKYMTLVYHGIKDLYGDLTTGIDQIYYRTDDSDTGYISYFTNAYVGNSTQEGFASLAEYSNHDQYMYLDSPSNNQWARYTIQWYNNTVEVYNDETLVYNYSRFPLQMNHFWWSGNDFYVDAIDSSIDNSGFVLGTNANLNWSTILFNSEPGTQVNPYQNIITPGSYNWVMVYDLYGNLLDTLNYSTNQTYFEYTPANLQECFISISDQQNNYLDWEQFKIKLDGSLIYENRFLAELNDIVNVSLWDKGDNLISWTSHTVNRDDNYIPIQITLHSLKVYNQQEIFNHVNITENPIGSTYWSEWLAPNEITEYKLLAGNYIINVTTMEEGGDIQYAISLSGDDTIIISSDNTITQMLTNIENVNTTIGNQITEVNISIVNTQTEIENQIISVNIDLTNVNSTLSDQLVYLSNNITNLNSNIDTLFSFTNSSLINLNSTLTSSFYSIETNILDVGNNISQLTILIENDITMLNNSINSSEIAILTQILAINNTISNMVLDLTQSVYLVNNSIYNAVVGLGTTLSLVNNSIQGNLSFLLQVNPELTEIYVNTMFSEYLNWSSDVDEVRNQTTTFSFVNLYRDTSIELLLKYLNETTTIQLGAQETLNQDFIVGDIEYKVIDVESGSTIEDWQDLDETTVDIGFFEDNVPTIPDTIIRTEFRDYLVIGLIGAVIIVIIGFVAINYRQQLTSIPKSEKYSRNSTTTRKSKRFFI